MVPASLAADLLGPSCCFGSAPSLPSVTLGSAPFGSSLSAPPGANTPSAGGPPWTCPGGLPRPGGSTEAAATASARLGSMASTLEAPASDFSFVVSAFGSFFSQPARASKTKKHRGVLRIALGLIADLFAIFLEDFVQHADQRGQLVRLLDEAGQALTD